MNDWEKEKDKAAERLDTCQITVGTKLYGCCEGYFGRDSYGEKMIEAICYDWVVIRETVHANNEMFEAPKLAFFKGFKHDQVLEKLRTWANDNVIRV